MLSMAAWSVLTFPPTYHELGIGALVSLLAVWLSREVSGLKATKLLSPVRWLRFFRYAALFVLTEARSVLGVAGSIITGNIAPAIVGVPVSSHTELGRFCIANSITLTPGTLTLLDERYLYVHCLNYKDGEKVAHRLDRYAAGVTE